jgi:hypothetical protein
MPATYPASIVKIPLAEDLSTADILADLSSILSHGYGELLIKVQDHVIITSSSTIHRRRANNRPHRATLP